MCVHVCLHTHTPVLKKLRREPCVSNTFSEFFHAHTLLHFRCKISKLIKITTISTCSLSFPLFVSTSFIHFQRSNLYMRSCSKRTWQTQGKKIFCWRSFCIQKDHQSFMCFDWERAERCLDNSWGYCALLSTISTAEVAESRSTSCWPFAPDYQPLFRTAEQANSGRV